MIEIITERKIKIIYLRKMFLIYFRFSRTNVRPCLGFESGSILGLQFSEMLHRGGQEVKLEARVQILSSLLHSSSHQ